MSSISLGKNSEEPGQGFPDASTNEAEHLGDAHDEARSPVARDEGNPLPSDIWNPLLKNTAATDVNYTELHKQAPSAAFSLGCVGGASKSEVEPNADLKAKAEVNERCDTQIDATRIVSTQSGSTANAEPGLIANLKDGHPFQAPEIVSEPQYGAPKPETKPPHRAPESVTSPPPPAPRTETEPPPRVPESKSEPCCIEPKTKTELANPKSELPFVVAKAEAEPANKRSEPLSQVPESDPSYQVAKTETETGNPKYESSSGVPETDAADAKDEPPHTVLETVSETKPANPIAEISPEVPQTKTGPFTPQANAASSDAKAEQVYGRELNNGDQKLESPLPTLNGHPELLNSFLLDDNHEGTESGTEDEQSAFMKELENFFKDRGMEFKPPKFYGEGLNCLKLWRAVMRLGGYDKVTSCKLWRQVGESFKPPKTCTTVSWTFRGFYEKALLDYERHKICGGELSVMVASAVEPMNVDSQAPGSGRARRDAAARAMQGWHSQRVLVNGEVSDPIIKDKHSTSQQKREKQLKSLGLLKRKKPSDLENAVKAARSRPSKPQLDVAIVDIGQPAEWVKINVQKTKDCFEVYALVPGLLREEVRVQSDPAGRLVISGEPEHPDNPWGVTPFKKVISLPARIDPHQTSAVVTLHGQLFVRVPFEQSDM